VSAFLSSVVWSAPDVAVEKPTGPLERIRASLPAQTRDTQGSAAAWLAFL
jgi:hypothetical protein